MALRRMDHSSKISETERSTISLERQDLRRENENEMDSYAKMYDKEETSAASLQVRSQRLSKSLSRWISYRTRGVLKGQTSALDVTSESEILDRG